MHSLKTNPPTQSVHSGRSPVVQPREKENLENTTSEALPTTAHDFSRIPVFPKTTTYIQPKLTINQPGDQYEQEADQMVEQVMRMHESSRPLTPIINRPVNSIQRQCADCEKEENDEEEEGMLMRKAENGGGFEASPGLTTQLEATKGGGFPLPGVTRGFMERAFHADFSGVRLHTDARASEMSRGIQARAFTHGRDIYFNRGAFAPETNAGQRLLAHELVHTLQQRAYSVSAATLPEEEAATSIVHGHPLPTPQRLTSKDTLQRQDADMSRANWQDEADHLTPAELSAEIDRMRRSLSTESIEHSEELQSRLLVFERAVRQRDAPMLDHQRGVQEQRRGAVFSHNVFVSGFESGILQEIPPGEARDSIERLSGHPNEFMQGCAEGIGPGFIAGATGLVESIQSIPLTIGRLGVYALQHEEAIEQIQEDASHELVYQVLGERLYTRIAGSSYLERRASGAGELQRIIAVIERFAEEIGRDPTIVIQWSGDLGLALGQSFGGSITEGFLRVSPQEQGVIVGRLLGQILFEIVMELIMALATSGVGLLLRAIPAVAQGVRASARVLRLTREMAESSPLVRQLPRLLSAGGEVVDDVGDATRALGRTGEIVETGAEETVEGGRRVVDATTELDRPPAGSGSAGETTAIDPSPSRTRAATTPEAPSPAPDELAGPHAPGIDAGDLRRVGPVNDQTLALFREHPELLEALADNSTAARFLKHCNSPCFPESISTEQIERLQHLLDQIESHGATDLLDERLRQRIERANTEEIGEILNGLERDLDIRNSQAQPQVLGRGFGPLIAPERTSIIDRPRGSPRSGVLSGDIGEAAEAAEAGATRLPRRHSEHQEPTTIAEHRRIFSESGEDALRLFADRLVLPPGGLRQVEIPVGGGTVRRVDRLFVEGGQIVLREVKNYPRGVLSGTPRIMTELEKDLFLLDRYSYARVDWYLMGNVRESFLTGLRVFEAVYPGRFVVVPGPGFSVIP